MLTLFASPKPFRGHLATIQRNAIGSWTQLHPSCQILLFGDEEGAAEVAREFNVRHVPNVARNEYDTPLLNDVFEKADRLASHDVLCYVNCDIILMSEFMRAVERVNQWREHFLMVGQCWNLDVAHPLMFDHPEWEAQLRGLVEQMGRRRSPYANDYFVFPRGFYQGLPQFALGRAAFDHWLIWKARALKAAVVDATQAVVAVHQNHDYSHVPTGKMWSYQGDEARRNMEIAGGRRHFGYTLDASHRLKQTGIEWSFVGYFRLKSRRSTLRLIEWGWRVLDLTRPMRHLFGLHMANWRWIKASLPRHR